MKQVVHAACPHDCPDACGVLITVEDGRATKIQGDPAHPVTQGFLCAKVTKYLDRVYSPDRVLYPLRRVTPKGFADKRVRATRPDFERITWDEALDEIAKRLKNVAGEFGSEAILPFSYGGTLGKLGYGSMDRRFFHRLGASQLHRNICAEAGAAGVKSVYGVNIGTDPEQFRHSKYIIAWAANIHGNNVHLWPFIEEARREGAKLVVIDPYRTRTAACADWHLPINPGTDVALALAMMHVIIKENLHDANYVAQYALGFDDLRAKVQEYPPEKVASWTGISAADIRKLAHEYVTVRPAVIRMNYGVQRSENGGTAARVISMLPIVTGSWKEIGGGFQLSTSGAHKVNEEALERQDLMQKALGRPARTLNMAELGKQLNYTNDPPVKALFVYNSNPGAICPNHNDVIRGLLRPDLFTVVHEQFFTDTTDYADIVLPATTFFEHKDLQKGYGHYYLQVSNQAIEPLGECRSNVEVFRALAERMGFEEECFRESVDEMIDVALESDDPWMDGMNRERLELGQVRMNFSACESGEASSLQNVRIDFGENPHFWQNRPEVGHPSDISSAGQPRPAVPICEPFLPFAHGGFRTPSGKAELYCESLKTQGLDPVAEFRPPAESRHGTKQNSHALELLARKADNFLNTTFSNLPSVQVMEEPGLLEISAADAQARGIADG